MKYPSLLKNPYDYGRSISPFTNKGNPVRCLPRLDLVGKQLVVGLVGDEGARAYAHADMATVGVLNDTFDGLDIVVAFDRSKGTTAIFDRTVDGELLTFSEGDERRDMTDDDTGTVWSKLTGIAVDGPLEGRRLKPVLFFNSFWFAWSDFYPNTELFEP